MTTDPSHDEISERARTLWQERGQPSGQDDDIWFQAEHELRGRPDLTAKPAPAPTASDAPSKAKPAARENGRDRNRPLESSEPRGMARSSPGRSQYS